jgi:hypothetical protein
VVGRDTEWAQLCLGGAAHVHANIRVAAKHDIQILA